MIRNMRKTKKFTAVISAITACMILVTTVLASGVLANEVLRDDNKIEVSYNDTAINLKNKPFIQNGEVYLPIREMLQYSNIEGIEWKNETQTAILTFSYQFSGSSFNVDVFIAIGSNDVNLYNDTHTMRATPILKDGMTYVPYEFYQILNDIYNSYNYANKSSLFEVRIYDKDGNLLKEFTREQEPLPTPLPTESEQEVEREIEWKLPTQEEVEKAQQLLSQNINGDGMNGVTYTALLEGSDSTTIQTILHRRGQIPASWDSTFVDLKENYHVAPFDVINGKTVNLPNVKPDNTGSVNFYFESGYGEKARNSDLSISITEKDNPKNKRDVVVSAKPSLAISLSLLDTTKEYTVSISGVGDNPTGKSGMYIVY